MSEESEREAYEQQRYEQYCYEKQREEAALEAAQEEDERRLFRYGEAIRLLTRIKDGMEWNSTPNGGHWLVDACALRDTETFLADEPKETK